MQIIQRPQLMQQLIAPANRRMTRRIQKRKHLDLPQPMRLHPQNHLRQIRPLNLRHRELRPLLEILLFKQPDAHPILHPPRTPRPLVRTAL